MIQLDIIIIIILWKNKKNKNHNHIKQEEHMLRKLQRKSVQFVIRK